MNPGGDTCARTELQLHFLPRIMKDEIGPDVVGANDILWKPATDAGYRGMRSNAVM